MRKGLVIMLAGFLVYGAPVLAREGGGGNGGHSGHHEGMGGHGQHGSPGGSASGHMSERGVENTNAQWSTGAARGDDRSDLTNHDRRGRGHEAGEGGRNHGKGKHRGHEHRGKDKADKDKAVKGKGDKGHKNNKVKGGKHNGSH